ncbi:uncharacterized [Tachysurus ichikawai]
MTRSLLLNTEFTRIPVGGAVTITCPISFQNPHRRRRRSGSSVAAKQSALHSLFQWRASQEEWGRCSLPGRRKSFA